MSLYEKLLKATSEEDVKDAYIKALGLKEYQKNLVDIQTKEIWFEAKRNASGDFPPLSFKPFEEAYKALSEKLQPMVYELGFLKV